MAAPVAPRITVTGRCTSGVDIDHKIESFLVIPKTDFLLTFQDNTWATRSLTTGGIFLQTLPTPSETTESMWADRKMSPDGRWNFALNGQSAIEFRPQTNFEDRRLLEWPISIPKRYGFWSGNPDMFLVLFEGGVSEIWDLNTVRRVAHSPEIVEQTAANSHWPPSLSDGSAWLQLTTARASICRARQGVERDFGPLGRWPFIGGGLASDQSAALLVTGGAPVNPQPDWWVGGEFLSFDLPTGRIQSVCAHGIVSGPGARALVSPRLSHVFLQTNEGGLACLEASSGRVVWTVGLNLGAMTASFTIDGKRCLAGLGNGEAALIGEKPDQTLWRVRAHEFGVLRGALSPDAKRAVTLGADRSLIGWNAEVGKPVAGSPALYDRTKDPAAFLIASASSGKPDLSSRLGPSPKSLIVSTETFTIDAGNSLKRYPIQGTTPPVTLWEGFAQPSPDGAAYIVCETLPADKKKRPQLGIFRLDPATQEKRLVTSIEAPDTVINPPLYLSPTRLLLPCPDGSVLLLRLDKKLFRPQIPIDMGGLRITGMGFYAAADGSAFAVSHGAELRLFRSDDGHCLARLVLEVPRRPNEPAVVGCWVGTQGRELIVVLQSGIYQRWAL